MYEHMRGFPLPAQVMGVRVRDSARLFSFLPGGSSWADPICGVCSVPLGQLMPSYARHMAVQEQEEAEAAERRRKAVAACCRRAVFVVA